MVITIPWSASFELYMKMYTGNGSSKKFFSRRYLIGVLLLLIVATSCNFPGRGTQPPVGTILPDGQTPTNELIGVTPTAVIPVTGMTEVALQCQFCVNGETHAVLIMPQEVAFNVAEPLFGITCLTVRIIDGQRILLCRGAQETTFSLNVCTDGSNCRLFPVTLAACPSRPEGAVFPPQVTLTAPIITPTTAIADTPTVTISTPTVTIDTPTIAPTSVPATVIVASPAATRVPRQPGAATPPGTVPLPATATTPGIPQPGTQAQSPEQFIRWYFNAVWNERNYETLWNNYLTANFKVKVGSGIYKDYVGWWDSVKKVDVNTVEVIRNDGTHALVRVNINFHMQDGRVINNQEYEYSLLYDAARQTWMFD